MKATDAEDMERPDLAGTPFFQWLTEQIIPPTTRSEAIFRYYGAKDKEALGSVFKGEELRRLIKIFEHFEDLQERGKL